MYINRNLSTNSFLCFGNCYILFSIFFAFNHSMKYTFNQKSSIYFVNVLWFLCQSSFSLTLTNDNTIALKSDFFFMVFDFWGHEDSIHG